MPVALLPRVDCLNVTDRAREVVTGFSERTPAARIGCSVLVSQGGVGEPLCPFVVVGDHPPVRVSVCRMLDQGVGDFGMQIAAHTR